MFSKLVLFLIEHFLKISCKVGWSNLSFDAGTKRCSVNLKSRAWFRINCFISFVILCTWTCLLIRFRIMYPNDVGRFALSYILLLFGIYGVGLGILFNWKEKEFCVSVTVFMQYAFYYQSTFQSILLL